MHRQLDQVRAQFEHYQESIALQRAEERHRAEQARTRLENEIAEARRTMSLQQTSLGQVEIQLSHVNQERDRAISELTILKADLLQALAARQSLEHQVNTQAALVGDLRSQLDRSGLALTQANTDLAILQSEKPQLQTRITALEDSVQELTILRNERLQLQERNQALEKKTGTLEESIQALQIEKAVLAAQIPHS